MSLELEIFGERYAADLPAESPLRAFLNFVFQHSYENHVRPSCEADIRRRTKEKADRETVRLGRLCADPEGPVPEDAPEELVSAVLAARRSQA